MIIKTNNFDTNPNLLVGTLMDSLFLKELVENLAALTRVKYVLVARVTQQGETDIVETIILWSHGKIIENIQFALYGTPCKEILDGNIRFYSEGVQELFPEDEELKSMNAEGYLGCPILSTSGQCFGYISILDTTPLENEQELVSIIRAFASLASSEIERNQVALRDISLQKKDQDLREAELIVLEMISQNKPQKEIFERLCITMENQASSRAFASVLIVSKDASCLELGAAPSFNHQVQEALDGLTIGESSGSCAAAVFRKSPVFVNDVQTDPLWAKFREFAKEQNIVACWSMPFLSETGEVLGSFALTHSISVEPTESDVRLMKVAAHLAGITVERCKAHQAMTSVEEKFSKALEISPDGVVITRVEDGKIIDVNDACARMSGYSRKELIGKTTLELNFYSVKERDRVVSLLKQSGRYAGFESTLRRKDGKVLNTLYSGAIFENNGESCIFAIVHDDTQRKQDQRALIESEERFRSAFGKAPIVVTLIDKKGIVLQSNEKAHDLLGYTEEEIVGRSIGEFTHPEDLERSMNMYKLLVAGELDHYEIEKRYIGKSGQIVWAQLNISSVKDEQQNFSYAIAHNLDITERKKSEIDHYERTEEEAVFANMLKFSFLPIDEYMQLSLEEILSVSWIKVEDKGGIFLTREQGDSKILQLVTSKRMPDELLTLCNNVDFGTCLCGRAAESMQVQFADCVDERHETRYPGMAAHGHYNIPIINDDKVLGVIVLYLAEGHQSQKKETGFLKRVADVLSLGIARKYAEDKVNYQAAHDSLTGLISRREFESRLQHVLALSDSNSEHALCYLDLDQFKVINDDCGHLAGDELLHQLAVLLQSKVRKRDTLARLGGDEFGLLMEHCPIGEAMRVAESLRRSVEEFRFTWEKKNFSLGVSIGLVPIISGKSNVKDVLGAADAACYAAKDAGRNRIHIYNPEDVGLAQRRGEMKWVTKIKDAIDEDRLRLYVQPIVPLFATDEDKDKKHFECLVRMMDEDGKIIPPGAFLPAAERYDLSTRIDQWVFDATCAWLEKRPGKSKGLTSCSVNLSGHSLSNDEFLKHIVEKLDKGKILPSTICFEITETVAISKLSNAIKFMEVLKDKGCSFALDDFGSGVSSFGYLKNLPVDFLKIDGMFVRDMVDDPIDLEMVRSINEIGHVMGKRTIAEFVENKEILASLKELGVDYAQGYHLGKPRAVKVPVLKVSEPELPKKKAKRKLRKIRSRRTD